MVSATAERLGGGLAVGQHPAMRAACAPGRSTADDAKIAAIGPHSHGRFPRIVWCFLRNCVASRSVCILDGRRELVPERRHPKGGIRETLAYSTIRPAQHVGVRTVDVGARAPV